MKAPRTIRILDFLKAEFLAQQDRLPVWLPVFFGIGIIVYFHLRVEPPLLLGAAGAAGALFIAIFMLRFKRNLALPAFLMFLVFAGFAAASWRTERVYTPLLNKAHGPADVTGTVIAIEPKEEGQGARVVLEDLEIEDMPPEETPRRVRLLLREDKGVRAGDRIKGLARLNAPSGPVLPGAFDFQRYAYFQRLGAVGFFYRAPEVISSDKSFWGSLFERQRARITQEVRENVQPPYSEVVNALLTGQRQGIREEDKEAMRESGLAHLLAISGLHVGMVAGAIFFFIRLVLAGFPCIALNYPIKKIAAMIALCGAAYYTFVVGAAIPAQRALMMTGLVLIAIMLDRSPFSLRLVALAAMAILIIAPEALMGVSFQMSFAAVVCLIVFYDWARPWWSSMYSRAGFGRRAFMYLLGVTSTTVIAGFATGLFALYHFQQFALYGVLSNIIAVPIIGFIVMPAAVLYYVLSVFGFEALALNIMEGGVSWVLATAHWTAHLEGAVLQIAAWPDSAFALMLIGSLFAILWQGRLRYAGLGLALIGFAIIPFFHAPDILTGQEAKLVGIRSLDGKNLSLSSGRASRFTAENWMRLNGQEGAKPQTWPKEGSDKTTDLRCDVKGCRLEREHFRIAFPRSETAIKEECLWADLIVAPFPVECEGPLVFDLFRAMHEGTAAVYLDDGAKIITDRDVRGQRPWTSYRLN